MFLKSLLIFLGTCVYLVENETLDCGCENKRKFPEGFLFATATASYQIEGAWNEDGKSENIWDRLTHLKPCRIKNCDTGDVADDSYHQYKRDVEMMRELGLDFYRFSISWTRILPTSFPDQINEAGVQYYNNLIDEMLEYGITPIVTIYHWDLPQKLQELGGWANPNIADWFTDYARVLFQQFGDRVKYWITINEPKQICYFGYAAAYLAPMYNISGYGEYLCAKNLLVAHAKAWHLYNDEFRATQKGTIGITINAEWYEPESEKNVDAAEDLAQFEWGQYAHPIFSAEGDFPPVMKKKIGAKSAEQGFLRSRLPEFTKEEIEMIRGTSDFFGLNHYSSAIVYRNESVVGYYASPSYYDDVGVITYADPDWEVAEAPWLYIVPWGFYKLLTKIREDYNNPPVFITENGISTKAGVCDEVRIRYYRQYLDAMLDAIDEGSDIQLYTAWSLMDNFEWAEGYTQRFGLYEVDYESPERTRTPRASAYMYKEIIRTGELDFNFQPDPSVPMTIDDGH